MVRCGRVGRQRAFEKINRALGLGVRLEAKHLDGKAARAVWSIYKPGGAVICDTDAHPALLQDCVTVNYIVAGAGQRGIGIYDGKWTLEVPDHALGRAVERSGMLHPGAIIREAHVNLLELPATVMVDRPNFRDTKAPGLYVKAGPGCFVGHIIVCCDPAGV
jgi:hypothetical protein